ncbi:MAG: FtsX-like permease family protein [Acidobacteriota bacterium]
MILKLSLSSLKSRKLATFLTILSLALSVALFLGVEQVRTGVRESFSNTISGTDLIVGTRVGQLQLILFTVFGIGSTPANISYSTMERYQEHPAVDWTVPFSLGDSHRGFRVVGTTEEYYEKYRYRKSRGIEIATGGVPVGTLDAAVGYQVARELDYEVGDEIIITHGISGIAGISDHDDSPFTIVGILDRTATPIDRTVYISLEGMEYIHDGGPPTIGTSPPSEGGASAELGPAPASPPQADKPPAEAITAFFVGVKSRIDTLRLQREINTDKTEPLLAIIPGVALAELWRGIDLADTGLKVIVALVVLVGLLGMLISLLSTLNERRREMAILRALGARPRVIAFLLVIEAGLLSVGGVLLGLALNYGLLLIAQPLVESAFGLALPIRPPSEFELWVLLFVVVAGTFAGLVPALRAYRNALSDGLAMRV